MGFTMVEISIHQWNYVMAIATSVSIMLFRTPLWPADSGPIGNVRPAPLDRYDPRSIVGEGGGRGVSPRGRSGDDVRRGGRVVRTAGRDVHPGRPFGGDAGGGVPARGRRHGHRGGGPAPVAVRS